MRPSTLLATLFALSLAVLPLGCERATSTSHAPPAVSSTQSPVAPSSASAAGDLVSPPLLTIGEVGKPPSDTISCDTTRPPPPESVLRQRANSGDPCALAALGEARLGRAMTDTEFRDAADLLRRAHDRKARIGACHVFDLGIGMDPDPRRAAVCAWRSGAWTTLAAAHALGRGVPRDLRLARLLLDEAKRHHPYPDCTHDQVQDLIDKGDVAPSSAPTCDHAACTTLDLNECASQKLVRDTWVAAWRRAEIVAKLAPAARTELDALLAAMTAYARDESLCVYWEYADGSVRNLVAMGREGLIRTSFDRILAKVVDGTVPAVSVAEVAKLRKDLASARKTQLGHDFIDKQSVTPFHAACDKAHGAYRKYEDAWVKFGATIPGSEANSALALRAMVLQERTAMLGDDPLE